MMKLLNKKQKNNGGFSLVELIVVIAIMVVLVAVLAPVFTKYIESSRKSTDVQNANSIAEAVLADYADQKDVPTTKTEVAGASNVVPTGVQGKDQLKVKGKEQKDKPFYFTYTPSTNTCAVYAGDDTNDLTTEAGAKAYKGD